MSPLSPLFISLDVVLVVSFLVLIIVCAEEKQNKYAKANPRLYPQIYVDAIFFRLKQFEMIVRASLLTHT